MQKRVFLINGHKNDKTWNLEIFDFNLKNQHQLQAKPKKKITFKNLIRHK